MLGTHAVAAFAGLCLLVPAAVAQVKAVDLPERRVLFDADYRGVRLLDGSLKRQLDEAKDYYLRIPNDDLLLGFRRRAGLAAPGREMGGWYTGDVFHVFGQILSGLSRLHAATGDPACKAKVDALVAGWAECIAPDGYFYFTAKPNAPHYTYDKMVGGLVDAAVYAGNADAIGALSRITDWAVKNLDRSNVYAFNAGQGSTEWYTLSENLYRAYLATGDIKYRDFAGAWEYTQYWDLFAKGTDIFAGRPDGKPAGWYHAYSHVNTLGGAGLAYMVKGEKKYLDTLTGAYDYLQASQCFATGGYGPNESLLAREQLRQVVGNTANTFETQCGTWAAFKMAKQLIALTGDAKYGDWVERLAINGIGATVPMTSAGGVMYYSDYNLYGGAKRNAGEGWTCCTGTRPMAAADVCDLVYFTSADSIYVNLFTPSRLEWKVGGKSVSVTQTTRFPEGDGTVLVVGAAAPAEFGLGVRVPSWVMGPMTTTLNGRRVRLAVDEKHWMCVRRVWSDGDWLEVTLPQGPRAVPLSAGAAYPAAVTYGPTVLAMRSERGNPSRKIDFAGLKGSLVASPGEALTFHLKNDPSVLARPFYAYKEGEEYFMYFDPTMADRIPYRAVKFEGAWNEGGRFRYGNAVGAWCEASFEGTGVRWLGFKFDDAGRAEVRIDGEVVGTVDQYGPGRDLPFDWQSKGLAAAKHTVRLTIVGDKTEASKDRFINVAGFEVLGGP